jgi:hypothetical protein
MIHKAYRLEKEYEACRILPHPILSLIKFGTSIQVKPSGQPLSKGKNIQKLKIDEIFHH